VLRVRAEPLRQQRRPGNLSQARGGSRQAGARARVAGVAGDITQPFKAAGDATTPLADLRAFQRAHPVAAPERRAIAATRDG
jgi:hypothetical protein